MKIRLILVLLVLLSLVAFPIVAAAEENYKERGRYIYDDEVNRLTVESELGLSAYLWKLDVRTGYEIVIVFPKEKLNLEQMTNWFNQHGVGKEKKDNGLAIFVFPDDSVFVLIGRTHDRIAVPYVSTYGGRTLKGLDKEPVLALLSFLNALGKKIDEPTAFETVEGVGKKAIMNLDVILLWLLLGCLGVLLIKQRDGFQMSDFKIPIALSIFTLLVVGVMAIGADDTPTINREYGMITSTKQSSYVYTETHCDAEGENCRTEWHTRYLNDVTILTYDWENYEHRFGSTDSKWAWERKNGDLLELTVTIQDDRLIWVNTYIDDSSGGRTDRYGTWVKTK